MQHPHWGGFSRRSRHGLTTRRPGPDPPRALSDDYDAGAWMKPGWAYAGSGYV
jgi:hypothetical protein